MRGGKKSFESGNVKKIQEFGIALRRKNRGRLLSWAAAWLLALLFCLWFSPEASGAAQEKTEEIENLYARGAVLMDGDSGRILFAKNQEEVLPMASTTKIMTCILALEFSSRQEICQVSAEAAAQPAVHLGMREGETYYLNDLLYSMMLESHNDSAWCVAEHVAGSVEAFSDLMDEKAREMGCENTNFVTPNGLDGEDEEGPHSTTAKDLALMMRYCVEESPKREEFLEITQKPSYNFGDVSGKRSFSCVNHNGLLTMMEGALTGKTGFTGKAGYCYVGTVRRGERTLVAALLACGWPNHKNYKWSDIRKLMDYGFSNYKKKTLDLSRVILAPVQVEQGTEASVNVAIREDGAVWKNAGQQRPTDRKGGNELSLSMLLKPEETLRAVAEYPRAVGAPVTTGGRAGWVVCFLGQEEVARFPLVYEKTVEKLTFFVWLERILKNFLFM